MQEPALEHYEVEIVELPSGKKAASCPICKARVVRFTEGGLADEMALHMNVEHDGGRRVGNA